MSYELTGIVTHIGETQEFGNNGFTKRQIVVKTDEKYPQEIAVDFTKDKCDILDNYGEGQTVTISFNLSGREYNGRYYVNLTGWKINEGNVKSDNSEESAPVAKKKVPGSSSKTQKTVEKDELPF